MAELIIIGMGGHSKVVTDIAVANGYQIKGYLDDKEPVGINNELYLGRIDTIPKWVGKDIGFIIAIGNNSIRKSIAERHESLNLNYVTLIHPTAIIGSKVEILGGTVVMPGAIINADSNIGQHVIVNTSAVIDHDCMIGDYVHIAQGTVIAGGVTIGSSSHICVGERVKSQSIIGANCIFEGQIVTYG